MGTTAANSSSNNRQLIKLSNAANVIYDAIPLPFDFDAGLVYLRLYGGQPMECDLCGLSPSFSGS